MGELWHQVIAIIYNLAWASQSIIQIIANYRLKTVQGYSVNYFILAMTASIFYSIYSISGFIFPSPATGTVILGDLLFAVQNTLMLFVLLYQVSIYPKGKNKLSGKTVFFVICCWIVVIVNTFIIEIFHWVEKTQYWNVLSILGYGKMLISLIKYCPAIYWNYKRKSTKGWPAAKMILDLIGGIFALVSGSISVENGLNIAKFGLALLTIVYDLIFLFQAFVLYRNPKKSALDEELQKQLLVEKAQKQ